MEKLKHETKKNRNKRMQRNLNNSKLEIKMLNPNLTWRGGTIDNSHRVFLSTCLKNFICGIMLRESRTMTSLSNFFLGRNLKYEEKKVSENL